MFAQADYKYFPGLWTWPSNAILGSNWYMWAGMEAGLYKCEDDDRAMFYTNAACTNTHGQFIYRELTVTGEEKSCSTLSDELCSKDSGNPFVLLDSSVRGGSYIESCQYIEGRGCVKLDQVPVARPTDYSFKGSERWAMRDEGYGYMAYYECDPDLDNVQIDGQSYMNIDCLTIDGEMDKGWMYCLPTSWNGDWLSDSEVGIGTGNCASQTCLFVGRCDKTLDVYDIHGNYVKSCGPGEDGACQDYVTTPPPELLSP